MDIKVLGPGCPRCHKLFEETRKAAGIAGVAADVVKVESMPEIASFGVMLTPALVIDDEVMFSGKVPSTDELVAMIRNVAGGSD